MIILQKVKHWLKIKLYRAVRSIQYEHDMRPFSAMKRIGDCPYADKDTFFNGMEYMEIGSHFSCGRNAWIEALGHYNEQNFHPRLVIGSNFSMMHYCHIGCIECIEIGDNVLLGSKVYISDHFHGNISDDDVDVPPIKRPLSSKPVKIGDNVWIGDNVSIMPGVTLGNNVIVGANAVVTKSFPDNAVIAGVPARLLRFLDKKG